MAVLSGQNLSCIKRDRLLFEDLSFQLNQSELLYIKGPNGAGKTSLIRILVGLAQANSGEVRFKQKPIDECRNEYHQQLVYFGHKLGLNHTLSGIENLRYWCYQHELPCDNEKLFQLLAELGLVGLEELPIGQLSAGQQRRVALCRLWLKTTASIWILDEPYTALDVQGIALLEEKMLAHLNNKGAILMTSHQPLKLDYPTSELVLEYLI